MVSQCLRQGLGEAYAAIGNLYSSGRGVQRDYNEALQWYQKTAGQGHASAQHQIGKFYYNGQGVGSNKELAYFWEVIAAECASGKDRDYYSSVRDKRAAEISETNRLAIDDDAKEWLRERGFEYTS